MARFSMVDGLLPVVAGVTSVTLLTSVPFGAALALLGTLVVLAGIRLSQQRLVTVGGALTGLGVVLGALVGLPSGVVLAATVATVLTWDAATLQVGLEAQLGPDAAFTSTVLGHGLSTTAVAGTSAMAVSLIAERSATGLDPATPVALLLLALVLIVGVMDGRT